MFNEFGRKNPLLFREWFFPNELKKQEIALLLVREANFWSVCVHIILLYPNCVCLHFFYYINPRANLCDPFENFSCGWGLPKGLSRRLRHQQVKNAANSSNSVGFSIELLSLLLWNSQLTGQSLSIGKTSVYFMRQYNKTHWKILQHLRKNIYKYLDLNIGVQII